MNLFLEAVAKALVEQVCLSEQKLSSTLYKRNNNFIGFQACVGLMLSCSRPRRLPGSYVDYYLNALLNRCQLKRTRITCCALRTGYLLQGMVS